MRNDSLETQYNYVDYLDQILKEPVLGEPELGWYVGVDSSGDLVKFEWNSEFPHLLIAGNTGSGKSEIVHSLLTQMLHNNHHHDVEFWLADPKKELQEYKHLDHVRYFLDYQSIQGSPIVAAQHLMKAAQQEMERRYAAFVDHPYKPEDLGRARYIAKKSPDQYGYLMFPYLFILLEECASYLGKHAYVDNYDRQAWAIMTKAINDIAIRGHAAGIRIITCTQYPTKENISQVLKQQSRRIGLRATDHVASKIILGSAGLEKIRTPGRGILTSRFEPETLIEFKGLWLHSSNDNNGSLLDERQVIIENIPYTDKSTKLPEGVRSIYDDTTVILPQKQRSLSVLSLQKLLKTEHSKNTI